VWVTSEFQLGQRGLEIFDDFLGDDVGVREIGAVFEAFVFEPEDVEGQRWQGASFTAGGIETLSVSREAGHFVR